MSYALVAAFAVVLGYLAGRQDRHDLGPLRKPRCEHFNNNDLARLQKRLRERDARLRVVRGTGGDAA